MQNTQESPRPLGMHTGQYTVIEGHPNSPTTPPDYVSTEAIISHFRDASEMLLFGHISICHPLSALRVLITTVICLLAVFFHLYIFLYPGIRPAGLDHIID